MKYKYKLVKLSSKLDSDYFIKELDKYGEKGWEVIEIVEKYDDYKGTYYLALMKQVVEETISDNTKELKKEESKTETSIEDYDSFKKFMEGQGVVRLTGNGTVTDPCSDCPNKNIPEGYIGDWPCEWCEYNKFKITFGNKTADLVDNSKKCW